MTYEETIIRSFIRPERRDRWLTLLKSAKGRTKLRAQLAHCEGDLDPRFACLVPPPQQTVESLLQLFGADQINAPVHVLSENADLDGQTMALEVALRQVVGRGLSTFLSIVPGRLTYFEGEEVGSRFICRRDQLS